MYLDHNKSNQLNQLLTTHLVHNQTTATSETNQIWKQKQPVQAEKHIMGSNCAATKAAKTQYNISSSAVKYMTNQVFIHTNLVTSSFNI